MTKDPSQILRSMGETFETRNQMYGQNYKLVGPVMQILFPDGLALKTAHDYELWHLFELMIVKLTRFACSGLTHKDSIHDAAVYAAMVESVMAEEQS